MAIVEINWNPTNRQLRQFGVICLFAIPLLGWIWGVELRTLGWLGLVGLVLALVGVVAPKAIKPVFLALTVVTTPIGMVLGEVVMLLVYMGVFLPIGMIFRLTRRDALQLKLDRQARTYWQPKQQPRDVSSYFRQS
jgi:hypothetical protein